MDILSKEGFRLDGRLTHELRDLNLVHKIYENVHELEYNHGETCIIARILNDAFDNTFHGAKKEAINFLVSFLDSGLNDRVKLDMRAEEIRRILISTFSSSVSAVRLSVQINVKQNGGGLIPAAFNASSIILSLAGVCMLDLCLAVDVTVFKCNKNYFFLQDPNLEEEKIGAKLTLAYFPQRKTVGYFIATKIDGDNFEKAYNSAVNSIQLYFEFVNDYLKKKLDTKTFVQ